MIRNLRSGAVRFRLNIQSFSSLKSEYAREIIEHRNSKRLEILEGKRNPYPHNFKRSHLSDQVLNQFSNLEKEASDSSVSLSLAGRVMLIRDFGKLLFITLKDTSGQIQIMCDNKILATEFDRIKSLIDSGDIVGVTGYVKRTKKGELSVVATSWAMLCKSLLPLPDKHYGLQDVNKRYRHRHLDMIVNEESYKRIVYRSLVIQHMRSYLGERGFLEAETPILTQLAGGAEATPFITHHDSLDMDLTLRIATELYLKRLVIGGMERVFEIGKIFRNEGISTRHNPEFTSIELYEAYSDYNDMMSLMENLVYHIASNIPFFKDGNCTIVHALPSVNDAEVVNKVTLDLKLPWRRVTMVDIVKEHCNGADFMPLILSRDVENARILAVSLGIKQAVVEGLQSAGEVLNIVFEEKCEKLLIQPVFITDYPVEISPLSKRKRLDNGLEDEFFVERFEAFMLGREHANGFTELNDPIEQRKRFEEQILLKRAHGDTKSEVDEDFLAALETGMPPTGGIGIGIDRLIMALTGASAIREVIGFPILRKNE